ncbi:MAG: hypothetical protein Q4E89_02025 [Eubacteriales bacterium]|nr:hypothetical protein [Eubacteriales bacterium]
MSTIALKNKTAAQNTNKESGIRGLIAEIKASYLEFAPEVICGMLMMNGNTNAYALYRALKK